MALGGQVPVMRMVSWGREAVMLRIPGRGERVDLTESMQDWQWRGTA